MRQTTVNLETSTSPTLDGSGLLQVRRGRKRKKETKIKNKKERLSFLYQNCFQEWMVLA
jgi:hypothetical protein